jgi:hypothetical protein
MLRRQRCSTTRLSPAVTQINYRQRLKTHWLYRYIFLSFVTVWLRYLHRAGRRCTAHSPMSGISTAPFVPFADRTR